MIKYRYEVLVLTKDKLEMAVGKKGDTIYKYSSTQEE